MVSGEVSHFDAPFLKAHGKGKTMPRQDVNMI